MPHSILVCQHRTCRNQGSAQVLAAFQAQVDAPTAVRGSSCLGQCGRGPMVVMLPEEIWYDRVRPAEVESLVARHLSLSPLLQP